MKRTRRTSLLVLTASLCTALSMCGCQSSRGAKTARFIEPSTPSTQAAAERSAAAGNPSGTLQSSGAAQPARDITFSAPTAGARSKPQRQPQLVGLYGELNGPGVASGSRFDGAGNLTQVSFATEGACVDPDIDPSGMWLAFASTMHSDASDIYLKSVHGKTLTQITTDPADDVMPAFSPDGKNIALASNRAGNWDIYITGMNGGPPRQITFEQDHELHPTWSPDGRSIAYCKLGAQSERWEIWVADVSNPGVRRFLDYGVFPQWSPDVTQSKILFQRAKQRGSRHYSVWTIDYVNGQALNPTEIVSAANAALINPSWSPDGRRVVFVTVVDPEDSPEAHPAQSDVWIVNIDGSDRTTLTNGQFANFQPVWASDGAVYFVSDRSGADNVWSVSAARATSPGEPAGVVSADSASPNSATQP